MVSINIIFGFKMVVRISVRAQLTQLAAYKTAEIVPPPQALSPIYASWKQSDDSRLLLAIAYSQIPKACRDGRIQVFEVPFDIQDSSNQYCGRGYSKIPLGENVGSQDCVEQPFEIRDNNDDIIGQGRYPSQVQVDSWTSQGRIHVDENGDLVGLERYTPPGEVGPSWTSQGWVQLADKTDFTCRKFFSKVLVFKDGLVARGWGDGTFLIKKSSGRRGATEVFRFINPNQPFIAESCGPVKSVWIQQTDQEVPRPFYRLRSTYPGGECRGCDDFSSFNEVLQHSLTSPLDIYREVKNHIEGLRLLTCEFTAAERPKAPGAPITPLDRLARSGLFEPGVMMSLVKRFLLG